MMQFHCRYPRIAELFHELLMLSRSSLFQYFQYFNICRVVPESKILNFYFHYFHYYCRVVAGSESLKLLCFLFSIRRTFSFTVGPRRLNFYFHYYCRFVAGSQSLKLLCFLFSSRRTFHVYCALARFPVGPRRNQTNGYLLRPCYFLVTYSGYFYFYFNYYCRVVAGSESLFASFRRSFSRLLCFYRTSLQDQDVTKSKGYLLRPCCFIVIYSGYQMLNARRFNDLYVITVKYLNNRRDFSSRIFDSSLQEQYQDYVQRHSRHSQCHPPDSGVLVRFRLPHLSRFVLMTSESQTFIEFYLFFPVESSK